MNYFIAIWYTTAGYRRSSGYPDPNLIAFRVVYDADLTGGDHGTATKHSY